MKDLVKENSICVILLCLFLSTAGLLLMQIAQGDAIIFCARNRSPFLNTFFVWVTKLGEEMSYITVGLATFFVAYRYVIGTLLTAFSATLLSTGLKCLFSHPRPLTYFEHVIHKSDLLTFVEGVELRTAWASSFPSGHTTSAFALFGLLILISKNQVLKVILMIGAILTGLSRIYLVQHFLKDVLAGAVLGVFIAVLMYQFVEYLGAKMWANQNVLLSLKISQEAS